MPNEGNRRGGSVRDPLNEGPLICCNPRCNRLACLDWYDCKLQPSGLCRDHLKHACNAVNQKSEGIPEARGMGLSAGKDEVHYSGMGITPF